MYGFCYCNELCHLSDSKRLRRLNFMCDVHSVARQPLFPVFLRTWRHLLMSKSTSKVKLHVREMRRCLHLLSQGNHHRLESWRGSLHTTWQWNCQGHQAHQQWWSCPQDMKCSELDQCMDWSVPPMLARLVSECEQATCPWPSSWHHGSAPKMVRSGLAKKQDWMCHCRALPLVSVRPTTSCLFSSSMEGSRAGDVAEWEWLERAQVGSAPDTLHFSQSLMSQSILASHSEFRTSKLTSHWQFKQKYQFKKNHMQKPQSRWKCAIVNVWHVTLRHEFTTACVTSTTPQHWKYHLLPSWHRWDCMCY